MEIRIARVATGIAALAIKGTRAWESRNAFFASSRAGIAMNPPISTGELTSAITARNKAVLARRLCRSIMNAPHVATAAFQLRGALDKIKDRNFCLWAAVIWFFLRVFLGRVGRDGFTGAVFSFVSACL